VKRNIILHLLVLLITVLLIARSGRAEDEAKKKPSEPSKAADAIASAQNEALEALAKYGKEWSNSDRQRTWKVRMECMVRLVRAGPPAVPFLDQWTRLGKTPHYRAFAAQTLGFLADPSARPVLAEAAKQKNDIVPMFANGALERIDRLEATPKTSFSRTWGVKPDPEPIRRALLEYDLSRMDTAQLGMPAPDFALSDTNGKTWRMSKLKDKKAVVLVFLFGDD
jgi:hypothetical protein